MSKRPQTKTADRAGGSGAPAVSPWRRLTQAAFVVTLVLVTARMTLQEMLRNPWLPVPGGTPTPAMPGPATSIALDLLCCIPALLVLARRLLDRTFRLTLTASHVAMFALAAWTLASVCWSSDRFAALVGALQWASALVLLWSTTQLVRSAVRLRVVAAVSVGILMVLLVQGYYYRFVDLPDLQQNWQQHRGDFLQSQGAAAGSTETIQLEKNILGGVPTGFNVSRNTYAAVLVLLMVIAAGVILQRLADGDGPGAWVPVAGVVALGLFMLYHYVQSKTAYATPILAAGLLMWIWRRRDASARRAVALYWAGVAAFVLLVVTVVGHGLKHGTLFHVSLTFRWQYWVGAARIFVHRPWLGTGWANFGSWYTAFRLPQAAEEPGDPHNFLVRAFVELGVFGGALMIFWMLRLFWEWTAGARAGAAGGRAGEAAAEPPAAYSAFPFLIGLAFIAISANAAISVDWSSSSALIIVETFKRLLFLIALLAGLCLVGVRSLERQVLDDRPAPWLLAAMLVGLALFLLHNLIDFSLFEAGPTFLFALLAGSALGMRQPPRATVDASTRGHVGAAAALTVGAILWLATAAAVWAPVAQAESLAQDADEQVRTSVPEPGPAGSPRASARPDPTRLARARDELLQAWRAVPYDGDYPFRAEQIGLLAGDPDRAALRRLLDAAVAADPRRVRYLNARAVLAASTGDNARAAEDYEQILRLDPHNLELRAQYATLLDRMGRHREAVDEYRKVLEFNDRLATDEIRRLPQARVEEIRRKIGG